MSDNSFPSDELMSMFKLALSINHAVTIDPTIDSDLRSLAANVISDFLELSREVMEIATTGFTELAISNMRNVEEAGA